MKVVTAQVAREDCQSPITVTDKHQTDQYLLWSSNLNFQLL